MMQEKNPKNHKITHIFTRDKVEPKGDIKKSERALKKLIKSGKLDGKDFVLLYFKDTDANWESTADLTFATVLWRLEQLKKELL